ncbi:MAG: exodeoxyribonuclease VII large subunit [Clostridia bacterium]|nr:exodeoxyribonuclease VII large subunit [Clostridia bacterium]
MNNVPTPRFISVSQLNFYIKSLVDGDDNLRYVFVTGEISNLTDHYSSGHIYLSLKDEKAVIKAVMFSYSAKNLKFKPQNGMKIIARGRVSVYEPSGQYQLYIEDMQPDGVGSLTIAYEQLKAKLESEGLFDKRHKKPIPKFPETISVITSPTGAALQDIRNILSRRWPYSEIVVTPVLVQGESASKMLAKAIEDVDKSSLADVIIIGRGGGSIEDLWAFNSEELARAIYKCRTPVISAVGHETDFTICDFVSDLRAPTPSAAAELATPDRAQQIDLLLQQRQYLFALIEGILRNKEKELTDCYSVLSERDPRIEFEEIFKVFSDISKRFTSSGEKILSEQTAKMQELKLRLFALDPSAILRRGYTVTCRGDKTIFSKSQLQSGDDISIIFHDGEVSATID